MDINLKLNPDFKSLKFKTWLYFIVFAIALMVILWCLQVFFLNFYYSSMRDQQTSEAVAEMESAYKHKSDEKFLEKVSEITADLDIYTYVITYKNGMQIDMHYFDNFIDQDLHRYESEIQTIQEYMTKVREPSVSLKLEDKGSSRDVFAYGSVLTSKKHDPVFICVFSPAWPISSTIKILKNQLIYVTIISLILACLISLYLSTRITRPIRKINASAKKLADGEYGIVFKGGHYTEINNLADTLTGASIKLEKADLAQKDLVANVSHDLKTPLTMIKSYAEMIRDISGENPEKREEHLQVIIDETDRLNGLVNDLLTVSRLQSGTTVVEMADFNLSETVRSIANTYAGMPNRYDSNGDGVVDENDKQFTIELECADEFTVNGDEDKIKQVVSNLISNAIKYCGSDVKVSLTRSGKFVEFAVEDDGPGIPAEDLDHVWERYYRTSSNTARSTEGTGLGLSICKEILTQHKADFGVDSTEGKGTRFWFKLQ